MANGKGIFLSIKDLMLLTGTESYKSAANEHKTLRGLLKKKSKKITIREYCKYEEIEFDYVWRLLRDKKSEDYKKLLQ